MSDQISDAVFTTEQVLDDDEPVRVPETFEDGRQTGEVTEFDIGFIDSINCHMAMISLNGDIIIPAYQTSTVTIDPRSRLRLITRLCVTQRRDHNEPRGDLHPRPSLAEALKDAVEGVEKQDHPSYRLALCHGRSGADW